jgi:ABC-2 type transport system permease protein
MFLFLLPAIILSGFLYPVDTMPRFFQLLTLANPLRHFIYVIRAVFLKGAGLRDLWQQFAILTVMSGAALAYATRRFRAALR